MIKINIENEKCHIKFDGRGEDLIPEFLLMIHEMRKGLLSEAENNGGVRAREECRQFIGSGIEILIKDNFDKLFNEYIKRN